MAKKLRLVFIVSLLFARGAFAQTSGTITINGSDPEAFSITNTSDGTGSSTISFGALTPANNNTLASGTAQVRLRSNKAYRVTAQASALSFAGAGATDGGASLSLADIGFGISALDTSGANVANTVGHTIVALYNYDPAAFTVTNGLTPFVAGTHGTLNDQRRRFSAAPASARRATSPPTTTSFW